MRGRWATVGVVLAAVAGAPAARSAETTVRVTVVDAAGRPVAAAPVGVLRWLQEDC